MGACAALPSDDGKDGSHKGLELSGRLAPHKTVWGSKCREHGEAHSQLSQRTKLQPAGARRRNGKLGGDKRPSSQWSCDLSGYNRMTSDLHPPLLQLLPLSSHQCPTSRIGNLAAFGSQLVVVCLKEQRSSKMRYAMPWSFAMPQQLMEDTIGFAGSSGRSRSHRRSRLTVRRFSLPVNALFSVKETNSCLEIASWSHLSTSSKFGFNSKYTRSPTLSATRTCAVQCTKEHWAHSSRS